MQKDRHHVARRGHAMVIVAGWMDVAPEERERFLTMRREAMLATRSEAGCIDYVFSPDPISPERVRLFERWEDRAALDAHLALSRSRPAVANPVAVTAREVNIYEVDGAEALA